MVVEDFLCLRRNLSRFPFSSFSHSRRTNERETIGFSALISHFDRFRLYNLRLGLSCGGGTIPDKERERETDAEFQETIEMLRCSNACVRGAGISAERRMAAMRMMSTSSRSRSSSMLMRGRVASLLLNPRPELGRQPVPVAMWIHNLGIRRMATEASELEPEEESRNQNQNRIRDRKGWEDFKVRNNNRYRNETRAQNHDGEAEILLDIAKAATAPRTKREADGIGSAGVVSKKVVDMEIKWLQDPKELADRVARLLKGREPALAVALVRRAQTDGVRCQVAWNHLLHHCMDRDAPQAAFRFYNEVRGGYPVLSSSL